MNLPVATQLADRDLQTSALLALIRSDQRPGGKRLALVEGPPGCGKTALLDTIVEHATETGALVLYAACSDTERHLQFAVLRQLAYGCPGTEATAGTLRQLDEDTLAIMLEEPAEVADRRTAMRIHTSFGALLATCAASRRVVVVIDDAHHIDDASAACLLYAVNRLRHASVAFAVAQLPDAGAGRLGGKLQVGPDCRLVTLGPLTESGVRRLLGEGGDALASACYERTGGNPLLVHAWAEDRRRYHDTSRTPTPGAPETAFRRALFRCLHRAPALTKRLAQGMAVLGSSGTPVTLARLLDVDPADVVRGIRGLTDTGLLEQGHFRHPDMPAAILADMTPSERAEMHARAAELLFEEGAAPRRLAEELLQAQNTRMSWAVCALCTAASHAAAVGDLAFASACLELAARDGRHAGMVRTRILELTWPIDPAANDRYVNGLREALCRGELVPHQAAVLVRHQLWHGRLGDAVDLLSRLVDNVDHTSTEQVGELSALRLWLSHTYPGLVPIIPDPDPAVAGLPPDPHTTLLTAADLLAAADLRTRAAGALTDVLHNRVSGRMVTDARLVLRSRSLDEPAFAVAYDALLVLLYSDELAEAAQRCAALLDAAPAHTMPTLHALLLATKAEIARRRGDLQGAEGCASAALEQIPERSWGVGIVRPLSTLILTLVAMRKLGRAEAFAERPIPSAALLTGPALAYRCAVGAYQIAATSLGAAQQTFLECGKLAQEWGLDMPTLAPWRAGLAEVHLRMGRREQANQLLVEQLRLLRGRYPRSRGMTMRQLAGTVDLEERERLLTAAVELLERSGDAAELALALYELGILESVLGNGRRARLHTQIAIQTAAGCGIPLLPSLPASDPPVRSSEAQHAILTAAELRVAMMAALGHTNRQIAEQLSVTPSTVEQHLTRVFRKLNVKQRLQLRDELGLKMNVQPLL
jgi:DNA-binding CsgD family transcriptional regulator